MPAQCIQGTLVRGGVDGLKEYDDFDNDGLVGGGRGSNHHLGGYPNLLCTCPRYGHKRWRGLHFFIFHRSHCIGGQVVVAWGKRRGMDRRRLVSFRRGVGGGGGRTTK